MAAPHSLLAALLLPAFASLAASTFAADPPTCATGAGRQGRGEALLQADGEGAADGAALAAAGCDESEHCATMVRVLQPKTACGEYGAFKDCCACPQHAKKAADGAAQQHKQQHVVQQPEQKQDGATGVQQPVQQHKQQYVVQQPEQKQDGATGVQKPVQQHKPTQDGVPAKQGIFTGPTAKSLGSSNRLPGVTPLFGAGTVDKEHTKVFTFRSSKYTLKTTCEGTDPGCAQAAENCKGEHCSALGLGGKVTDEIRAIRLDGDLESSVDPERKAQGLQLYREPFYQSPLTETWQVLLRGRVLRTLAAKRGDWMGRRKQADWHIYDNEGAGQRLLLYGAKPASGGGALYFYAAPKDAPLAEAGEDWLASVAADTGGGGGFKVTVRPGEDPALVLVAAYVVVRYGDVKGAGAKA